MDYKEAELMDFLEIEASIALARRFTAKGDWFAYWLGRNDAYEDVIGFLSKSKFGVIHRIDSKENRTLAMKILGSLKPKRYEG